MTSRPSSTPSDAGYRPPGAPAMVLSLVAGGFLGLGLGSLIGLPLAHALGISDLDGASAFFVAFAAMPACSLIGAALALTLLFRLRGRSKPPPAALIPLLLLGGALLTVAPPARSATPHSKPAGKGTTMRLMSPSFEAGSALPERHTSDGPDVSPALKWIGAPPGTQSFALIVDDPDAPDPANPKMTWVHWVLYDLPATAHELPEGVGAKALPPGTRQGVNDWKATGYRGPSPPIGRHRYYFKLYALDQVLPDLKQPTSATLQLEMKGHVLAQAELIGTYAKKR